MRDRRGPATVTGDAERERLRAAATGPPRAAREGADRSGPEARRPPSDHKAEALVERGGSSTCTSSSPAWRPVSRCSSRRRRRSPRPYGDRARRRTERHAARAHARRRCADQSSAAQPLRGDQRRGRARRRDRRQLGSRVVHRRRSSARPTSSTPATTGPSGSTAGTATSSRAGICTDTMASGRRAADARRRLAAAQLAATVFPLDLEGVPAQASRGASVTVTVVEYRSATGAPGEGRARRWPAHDLRRRRRPPPAGRTARRRCSLRAGRLVRDQGHASRATPRRPASSCACSRRVRR